jgi:integrase
MAEKSRGSSRADGVTVREVGRRRFEVDFTFSTAHGPCRKRLMSPERTIGESRKWAIRERRILIERGDAQKQEPRAEPASPRDFKYWAERYVEDAENPARRGGANRPGTVESKAQTVKRHLVPAFGRIAVTAISDELVEQYVLAKTRSGLAPNTIRGHLAKLIGVLRLAKKKGCPAERALGVPEVRLEKKDEAAAPSTLSEGQTDQLLIEFRSGETWHLALLTLLFRCGLRIGEALGLMWSDVNFERRTITVQRSAGRAGRIGPTKSGKVRSVHLHHQVRDALERLGPGHSWVFPSERSVRPRCYNSTRDAIAQRWPEFIGEDGKVAEWRSHIGRHSLGRHWAERGWPLKGLQELLGHADITTTQIYMHWSQAAAGPLLDQLGSKPTLVRTARARK